MKRKGKHNKIFYKNETRILILQVRDLALSLADQMPYNVCTGVRAAATVDFDLVECPLEKEDYTNKTITEQIGGVKVPQDNRFLTIESRKWVLIPHPTELKGPGQVAAATPEDNGTHHGATIIVPRPN